MSIDTKTTREEDRLSAHRQDDSNSRPGSIAFRRLSRPTQPAYIFVSFSEGGGGDAAGVYATTLQELLPLLRQGDDPELRLVDFVGQLRERSGTQEVRLTMAPLRSEANVLVVDCDKSTVAVCAPEVAPAQAYMTWSFKEFVAGQWDGPVGIGEMIDPGHAQRWGPC